MINTFTSVSNTLNQIYPYTTIYITISYTGLRGTQSLPQGDTLDRVPTLHSVQSHTPSHTTVNSEMPISLQRISLDWEEIGEPEGSRRTPHTVERGRNQTQNAGVLEV